MAEEEKKEEEKKEEGAKSTDETKPSKSGMFVYLILGAIVLGCAVGGFALAQLIAGPKTDAPPEPKKQVVIEAPKGQTPWQYDLPAVIGNLDEPGVTRYLRATITLVMSAEFSKKEGMIFIGGEEGEGGNPGMKDLLVDFMSDYIAGLTLERVRGQKNRRRIKKEVTEGFNEVLFPGQKPFVTSVLFKEFAVQ